MEWNWAQVNSLKMTREQEWEKDSRDFDNRERYFQSFYGKCFYFGKTGHKKKNAKKIEEALIKLTIIGKKGNWWLVSVNGEWASFCKYEEKGVSFVDLAEECELEILPFVKLVWFVEFIETIFNLDKIPRFLDSSALCHITNKDTKTNDISEVEESVQSNLGSMRISKKNNYSWKWIELLGIIWNTIHGLWNITRKWEQTSFLWFAFSHKEWNDQWQHKQYWQDTMLDQN